MPKDVQFDKAPYTEARASAGITGYKPRLTEPISRRDHAGGRS